MKDYKHTLNLPTTSFSMKANLPTREPKQLKVWADMAIYQQLRLLGKDRPSFILHDGPPYANARPHMGTALNKTIKDIIIKSKTLSGFNAPYVPGWDCHGLPIELNVEKKKGKAGDKLTPPAFRQACREYALKQVDLQREDFKRMGVFADWEKPYLTLDSAYEANTVRGLATMLRKGHLVRGQKPVHWCPVCSSALAEAEVVYQDKTSPAIDVTFDVVDVPAVAMCFALDASQLARVIVPIWTTTPWTLPANQAVALNPELEYVLLKVPALDAAIIVASALKEAFLSRLSITDATVLGEMCGERLGSLRLQHPFDDRAVPIVLADHVTTDVGTGCVHTAPVHGPDDYQVGLKNNLPQDNPVNGRSCFVDGTPVVSGVHVYKANEPILDALEAAGKLLHRADLNHSYPHCWRHKTPIIFRATPQWFISMTAKALLADAEAAAGTTQWLPAAGERRFLSMLKDRPDWCISRQRVWGTPITLLTHCDTGELHPNMPEIMDKVADLIAEKGIDVWADLDLATLIDDASDYQKTTDILDVWFDAGMSHFCVLEQRDGLHVPADLYFEGSDQHRGWFQSSLLTSVALREEAPYKAVLTHGYVVDKDGRKMSKSIGNTVSPIDVINKYGADILRLWAAASNYTSDIAYAEEIVQRNADAYRRIRNTARFVLSNLFDFNPETDLVSFDDLPPLEQWALGITARCQQDIIAAYDAYALQDVYQLLHNFCVADMGSVYLDVVKDCLYTAKKTGVERRAVQTVLYHVLNALVHWIAPILSFTAEEIWQHIPGRKVDSVFLSTWYDGLQSPADEQMNLYARVMLVRDVVNKTIERARQAGEVGSSLAAKVTVYASPEYWRDLAALGESLRFVFITSGADLLPLSDKPDALALSELDGVAVQVTPIDLPKCARCWHRVPLSEEAEYTDICPRCVSHL